MDQSVVALVGSVVSGLAFWLMITIIVLGIGNQILAWIGAAFTLGLTVWLFSWALGTSSGE